jgi:hypothetical protein
MITTRLLTCGYRNGLDSHATLSVLTGGVGARAGALAMGRALFIAFVSLLIILPISVNNAYAWKNHSMNLKLYAHNEIKEWSEFECYVELIHRESTWNYKARNGSHYGLGQMRSTWYRDLSPRKQIKAHIKYINHRYDGSPCKALSHLVRVGWH